jgi:signal transduction histidine kinase
VIDNPSLLLLLDDAPAAISVQRGPELRWEMANARYRWLLGGRDLVGRAMAEVVPDWAQMRRIVEGVLRDGKPVAAREHRFLIDPEGTGALVEAYLDFVCQPLRGADGALTGVLTFAIDVTQQAEARVRLETVASELQRAVEARDEFLSVASHELKTPLTALKLQVQALQRSVVRAPEAQFSPDQLRARFDAADRQVQRLVELIDTLLDVSRLHSGTLDLRVEEVELGALVNEVVDRQRGTATAHGSTITVALPGEPLRGRWDRSRIDQILTNLLSNAVKYGRGKPIEVLVAADAGRAFVSVVDHGIGIAADDHARIFQRFERAVSRTHYAGLGLGLWISRQIAEALGGGLTVESVPGHGARFTLALPR